MGDISPQKGKLFSLWVSFKTHFANWEIPIQICRVLVMFLLCSPLEVSRATDARAASLTPQRGGRGGNRYHGVCDPAMVTSMVQIWTKHIDHTYFLGRKADNGGCFCPENGWNLWVAASSVLGPCAILSGAQLKERYYIYIWYIIYI